MVKENINKLIFCIFIVLLLLGVCVTVDYATNANNKPINNINDSLMEINNKSIIVINNSTTLQANNNGSIIIASSNDKIHTIKEKKTKKHKKSAVITMTGKPSCGCRYSYTWHTRSYINYCPNCKHYNVLTNKHKWPARFEREISCANCDSDFCICCGKEKYSWSRVYLTGA